MSDSPSQPSPLPPVRKGRPVRKAGRPSRAQLAGRRTWISRLLSAGRNADAYTFAVSVNMLHLLPPDVVSAAKLLVSTPSSRLPDGGEGVAAGGGDNYNYNSTQEVQILQSGGKLTLGVGAIREVAGAIALAEQAASSGGSDAAQETAQELHSPGGESEGNRDFGQANSSVEKRTSVNVWGESRWVEEGEGIVGKVCRNKQYNELRMGKKGGGELWTKVRNWQWRNGFVRGERVWVNRVWVSGDDTDAEYAVMRRMDVNEEAMVVAESEPMLEPMLDPIAMEQAQAVAVAVAATAEAVDRSHVLPQFLKKDTMFPRKPESAADYILRIREEAAQWANGAAAGA